MTLIAGFKTSEGVVICADSQETLALPLPGNNWAEYRVSVDKIAPQRIGNYDFIIGGAGDGPLADGFAEALVDQIETWEPGYEGGTLKDKIRKVVLDYHGHEVALCPVAERDIHFLVCLKQANNPAADVHLWVIEVRPLNG